MCLRMCVGVGLVCWWGDVCVYMCMWVGVGLYVAVSG